MKPTAEQIGNLLALKRHERPEEGYFEDFLVDFHRRRREEEVRKTGLAGVWTRFSSWVSGLGGAKWAYAGGVAYIGVMAALVLAPREGVPQGPAATPVNFPEAKPVAIPTPQQESKVEQLQDLDLRPSAQGNRGEQVF